MITDKFEQDDNLIEDESVFKQDEPLFQFAVSVREFFNS